MFKAGFYAKRTESKLIHCCVGIPVRYNAWAIPRLNTQTSHVAMFHKNLYTLYYKIVANVLMQVPRSPITSFIILISVCFNLHLPLSGCYAKEKTILGWTGKYFMLAVIQNEIQSLKISVVKCSGVLQLGLVHVEVLL